MKNKITKMFIIAFIALMNTNFLSAKVVIWQKNLKDKTLMQATRKIFEDKDGKIWINYAIWTNQLFIYNNTDDTNPIQKDYGELFMEDSHNNKHFLRTETLSNGEEKQRLYFMDTDGKTHNYGDNMSSTMRIFLRDYTEIDNFYYLNMGLLDFPGFYFLEYDTINNAINFEIPKNIKHYKNFDKDSVRLNLSAGFVKRGREMIVPNINGLFAFNHDTKEHRIIRNPILTEVFNYPTLRESKAFIGKDDIISYPVLYKQRPGIIRVYPNDSVSFFHSPYRVCDLFEADTIGNGSYQLTLDAPLTPVNAEQTEFLFSVHFSLIYFSEKEGFKYIPKPAEIDTMYWSFMRDIKVCNKGKELWISCYNGCLIRTNLAELLATRTDHFPTGLASVEDILPGVPIMSIYKIHPQPAKEYFDCQYFVQEGKFGEVSMKIYDNVGREYTPTRYEIIKEEGVTRTLRIYPQMLSAGTYIINISDGANSASEKFIVK